MRIAYVWPSGNLTSNRYVSGFYGQDPSTAVIKQSNAGDMFVTEASLKLTRPTFVEFFEPQGAAEKTIDRINNEFDFIFIRGANTLGDHAYAGILAHFIEITRLPIVVMGIGIQAPSLEQMPHGPDVQRLANLLGERSKVVGVRGQITADFLERLGVRNVQIVGCPSLLRHNTRALRVHKPDWKDLHGFGFSLTRYHGNGYQRDRSTFLWVQSRLIKELHGTGRLGLITQVEREEKAFAYRDPEEMLRATEILRESGWFDPEMEAIYQRGSVFFGSCPTEYDMHVRNFDVIFGTRLHSNAMAIACGTPAITLGFDLRVQEIYEFWRLPITTVEDARSMSARDLYESADFAGFNAHIGFIYSNFRDYLEANGVDHVMTGDVPDDVPDGFQQHAIVAAPKIDHSHGAKPNDPKVQPTASARKIWENALPEELRFWEAIISGTSRHENYVENFRRRSSGVGVLSPHLAKYLAGKDLDSVEIIDVGSGPHTVLGPNLNGKRLKIWAIDPLANEYNAIMSAAEIVPAVPTIAGEAESLTSLFAGKRFDLVYSRNAIDHSHDAPAALQEMLGICKPGGVVFVEGTSNEAVRQRFAGLHQWNFMPVDGDLVVWKLDYHRSMRRYLRDYASLHAEGTAWYKAEIIK